MRADLGSAAVSCSLSGLLLGSTPVSLSAANDTSVAAAASAVASGVRATALHAEGNAQQHDQETDDQLFAAAEVDRAVAAAVAAEVPLNLGEYSGLVVRAIGDGKKYTVVLRTAESFRSGLEYHADFESSTKNFDTVRLPFSTFVPVRDGRRAAGAPELDRRQLVSLALAFYPQRNNPTQTTGEFYLSVSNVKAYRKRDEPEIVYISDAAAAADEVEAPETVPARVQTKLRGEHMLRSSGLTYFIVRPTQLTDAPSSRRLSFTQASVERQSSLHPPRMAGGDHPLDAPTRAPSPHRVAWFQAACRAQMWPRWPCVRCWILVHAMSLARSLNRRRWLRRR